jgi:hypothetical protein
VNAGAEQPVKEATDMNDSITPHIDAITELAKRQKADAESAGGSLLIPPHVWSALNALMHDPEKQEAMLHSLIASGAIKVFVKPKDGAE